MLADVACTTHVYLQMCLDGLRAWHFAVFGSVQAWRALTAIVQCAGGNVRLGMYSANLWRGAALEQAMHPT